MRTLIYIVLLVALVFTLSAFATSGCGRDPLLEIICADAPNKAR